jgi:hypothetical protein
MEFRFVLLDNIENMSVSIGTLSTKAKSSTCQFYRVTQNAGDSEISKLQLSRRC